MSTAASSSYSSSSRGWGPRTTWQRARPRAPGSAGTSALEVGVMARLAKSEKLYKDEHGAIMPLRAQRPAFPLSLMERMDDIFGERWSPWLAIRRAEDLLRMPPVDVYEQGDQVVVKAELPGLKKDEIEVEIAGDVITISGKKDEEEVEKNDYFRFFFFNDTATTEIYTLSLHDALPI